MRKLINSVIRISLAVILVCLLFYSQVGIANRAVDDKINNNIESKEELPDIVERVMPSVVYIYHESGNWQGSGVAIAPDIIVTARHVVDGGSDFTIITADGTEIKSYKAISSAKYDIGFIKTDEPILAPARFGSINGCRLGQSVFAIGSPYGKENFNRVTLGIISGLNLNLGDYYGWEVVFSTDASGHPGNSGCPVFTFDGITRGILVAGRSSTLVYCVPVDVFAKDGAVIRMMFAQEEYYVEENEQYIDVY